MEKLTITVLNPKVKETLKEWEAQNLIEIDNKAIKSDKEKLVEIIDDISNDVTEPPMTMDEIVKEVKIVRKKRYEARQNSGR